LDLKIIELYGVKYGLVSQLCAAPLLVEYFSIY